MYVVPGVFGNDSNKVILGSRKLSGNVHFDGSTISSANNDGNLVFQPSAGKQVVVDHLIVDNLSLTGNNIASATDNVVLGALGEKVIVDGSVHVDDITLSSNTLSSSSDLVFNGTGNGRVIFGPKMSAGDVHLHGATVST